MDQNVNDLLHQELLRIADNVVAICDRHGLKYYLVEGSLLGAIRHQGIIPWDDDIDIAMPRSDYDSILEYLDDELPAGYNAVSWHRRKSHRRYFIQVETEHIKLIEEGHQKPLERFAWIDIFPLDGMPGSWFCSKLYMMRLLYLRMMIQLSQFDEIVDIYRKNRPIHEKMIITIADKLKLSRWMSVEDRMKKLDIFLRRNSSKNMNLLINPLSAYKSKSVMPKSYYGNGQMTEFCGRKYRIPDEPERMLRQLYGNYMIPPVNPDSNHNIRIV